MVLSAFFSIALPGLACTVVYSTEAVGQTFKVKISGFDGSVAGLPVGLYVDGVSKVRAVTDKDGLALFRGVQPGLYYVSPDHGAGISGVAQIEVKQAESREISLSLNWPSEKPILSRSLRGTIHWANWNPGQSQPKMSLELLEGISGRVLEKTNTDGNGAFEFQEVARGLYFLRVDSDGLIAVSVTPGAPAERLDVNIGMTSCGLYYADRSSCPPANAHLDRLGGHVVDVTGGAISNADLFLLDAGGTLVQQARTDNTGSFASPRPPDGIYQLLVRSNGFSASHATLTFDSNGGNSPLEFQLGINGQCGRTNIQ